MQRFTLLAEKGWSPEVKPAGGSKVPPCDPGGERLGSYGEAAYGVRGGQGLALLHAEVELPEVRGRI